MREGGETDGASWPTPERKEGTWQKLGRTTAEPLLLSASYLLELPILLSLDSAPLGRRLNPGYVSLSDRIPEFKSVAQLLTR
jgi:hypothetical protein